MSDQPEARSPLIPADCDLTDFPRMPFDVARLRRSRTWLLCKANPELGFYLLNLWTAAWHSSPAGSLEVDDEVLLDLAMCKEARWPKVREQVLRNWIRCTDGRLYHETVAEMVLECWIAKLNTRRTSLAGNAKRHRIELDLGPVDRQIEEAVRLLAELNPGSRTLTKRRAGGSTPTLPPGSRNGPGGTPGSLPPGSRREPSGSAAGSGGDPNGVPSGSLMKRREGIYPQTPSADACGQLGPPLPAGLWWETREGVELAGRALGIGPWDERASQLAQGEHWPAYRHRVLCAAGDGPWMRGEDPPMRSAGDVLRGGLH